MTVATLSIDQSDLNTERMMELMAVKMNEGMPLYLHAIHRILRQMRIQQQSKGTGFDYSKFKSEVVNYDMTPAQKAPLEQRLDTLESFMPSSQTGRMIKSKKSSKETNGSSWTVEVCHSTCIARNQD